MPFPTTGPIEGVVFDFHATLVDQGDGATWLGLGWARAGRAGTPEQHLGAARVAALAARLDRVWEDARQVDPTSRRDTSAGAHREVFAAVLAGAPDTDPDLVEALHTTVTDLWTPYLDAAPTLAALRARGVRTAVVSNIGMDIRPVLARGGLTDLVDAVVLSYEVGSVKPHPQIFAHALTRIGVPPERGLMVGDSWRDDGGAAELGCRVLILPRTSGDLHGLDQVLRLVG
ncbi:MAG: HAD family hydrolase [Kineosporiaceae bacterium]